jgi:hypothetical protein
LEVSFSKKDWLKNCFEQFSYFVYRYGIESRDVATWSSVLRVPCALLLGSLLSRPAIEFFSAS